MGGHAESHSALPRAAAEAVDGNGNTMRTIESFDGSVLWESSLRISTMVWGAASALLIQMAGVGSALSTTPETSSLKPMREEQPQRGGMTNLRDPSHATRNQMV
jgi:hypothetical protein